MLTFAIDFDDTIDRNEELFEGLIEYLLGKGQNVCIVTNNYAKSRDDIVEFSERNKVPVFWAGVSMKRAYMENLGINVDVWIDDYPEGV